MGRSSPTRDLVRRFAVEALHAGRIPTQVELRDKVLEVAGVRASPHTVGNTLSEFWAEVLPTFANTLSAGQRTAGDDESLLFPVPEPLRVSEFGKDAPDPVPNEMLVELTRLQYDNRELRSTLLRQTQRIATVERELAEKESLLKSAIETAGDAVARSRKAEASADEARAQAEQIKAEFDTAVAAAREEALGDVFRIRKELEDKTAALEQREQDIEGTRRHLMLETDRIRTSTEQRLQSYKDQLHTAQLREQQYLIQKNAAVEEVGRLREVVDGLREELAARLSDGTNLAVEGEPGDAVTDLAHDVSDGATSISSSGAPPARGGFDPDGVDE